jgi:hypothetical protein
VQRGDIEVWLRGLASSLIDGVVEDGRHGIEEGVVISAGPAPYRRLDCDGRALAYVRARARKGIVRVDVTGLWDTPRDCGLLIPSAAGATLFVTSEKERREAVRFLLRTVQRTREARLRWRTRLQPRACPVAAAGSPARADSSLSR